MDYTSYFSSGFVICVECKALSWIMQDCIFVLFCSKFILTDPYRLSGTTLCIFVLLRSAHFLSSLLWRVHIYCILAIGSIFNWTFLFCHFWRRLTCPFGSRLQAAFMPAGHEFFICTISDYSGWRCLEEHMGLPRKTYASVRWIWNLLTQYLKFQSFCFPQFSFLSKDSALQEELVQLIMAAILSTVSIWSFCMTQWLFWMTIFFRCTSLYFFFRPPHVFHIPLMEEKVATWEVGHIQTLKCTNKIYIC